MKNKELRLFFTAACSLLSFFILFQGLGVRNYEMQDWRGHRTPAFTNGRLGG
jgi:hypothetical protein